MADDIISLGGPGRRERRGRIGVWATRIAVGKPRLVAASAALVIVACAVASVLSSNAMQGGVSGRSAAVTGSRGAVAPGAPWYPVLPVARISSSGHGCALCSQVLSPVGWVIMVSPAFPSGGQSARSRAELRAHLRS
jgi:hypothetical protein